MKFHPGVGLAAATFTLLTACGGVDADPAHAPETPEQAVQALTTTHAVPDFASDAEEVNGTTYTQSPVLELGYKDPSTALAQTTGVRFLGVDVPRGAVITSAYLDFVAVIDRADAASLRIHGQAAASAGPFVDGAGVPGTVGVRARTTNSVTWAPAAWTAGVKYSSPNLARIVEEITHRPDWVRGAALAFFISGTGQRKAHAQDAGNALEPVLRIAYSLPATSCLQGSDTVIEATPTSGVQYNVRDKGLNVGINAAGKLFSTSATPLTAQDNGANLCVSGGKYDALVGDNATWDEYHSTFGVLVVNSPSATFDNLAIHATGDALSFKSYRGSADGWTLRDSYIRHAGDDFIENDPKYDGLVDDVLVDWAYMGISCRKDANPSKEPPGTITVQDSLIALKRQHGTYNPASDPGHLFMFKWEKDADTRLPNCKLRLRNTVLYMQQDNKVFDSLVDPSSYVTECSNVTLVYAGSGGYSQENRERLQALRNKFPNSNCFDIKEGAAGVDFWRQKRSEWFSRHASNAQISYYRDREPAGAN